MSIDPELFPIDGSPSPDTAGWYSIGGRRRQGLSRSLRAGRRSSTASINEVTSCRRSIDVYIRLSVHTQRRNLQCLYLDRHWPGESGRTIPIDAEHVRRGQLRVRDCAATTGNAPHVYLSMNACVVQLCYAVQEKSSGKRPDGPTGGGRNCERQQRIGLS